MKASEARDITLRTINSDPAKQLKNIKLKIWNAVYKGKFEHLHIGEIHKDNIEYFTKQGHLIEEAKFEDEVRYRISWEYELPPEEIECQHTEVADNGICQGCGKLIKEI